MQFIYHKSCGDSSIILDKDSFHHVFSVRRDKFAINDILKFINLKDSKIYQYKLTQLRKKEAIFVYENHIKIEQKSPKTHIIQAVIDMNDFAKILPTLNELFVSKITFFYSDFSQKNQKINIERLEKILINSCLQCGRMDLMNLEVLKNLDSILDTYKEALALDFDGKFQDIDSINSFIIGAEGGFSKREKELLKNKSFNINHNLILRSTTATLFIASKKI